MLYSHYGRAGFSRFTAAIAVTRALRLAGVFGLFGLAACSEQPLPTASEPHTAPRAQQSAAGLPQTIDDDFADLVAEVPTFGGLFFDAAGVLRVQLTDTTQLQAARAPLTAFLARHHVSRSDLVVAAMGVRQAQFDFQQLNQWKHLLMQAVYPAVQGVTMNMIDVRQNRIVFGVRDASLAPRLTAAVASVRSVPPGVVLVEVVPPLVNEDNLQGVVPTVIAGVKITGRVAPCSLGANIYRSVSGITQYDQGYFLTSAHCMSGPFGTMNNDVIGQPLPDRAIGVEVFNRMPYPGGANPWDPCPSGVNCRYADVAVVEYLAGIAWDFAGVATSVSSAAPFNILGVDHTRDVGGTMAGSAITKVGQSTGATTGTVVDPCVDAFDSSLNVLFLCQTTATYSSALGDSGGQIFYYQSGVLRFQGIHKGRLGSNALYSNYQGINNDLSIGGWCCAVLF